MQPRRPLAISRSLAVGRVGRLAGSMLDDLVDVADGEDQAFEDVGPLLGLVAAGTASAGG